MAWVLSIASRWFFPGLHVVSSLVHVDQDSAEYWTGVPLQTADVPSVQLCPLCHSSYQLWLDFPGLSPLSLQFMVLTGLHLGSCSICHGLKTLLSEHTWAIVGLISHVSFLSRITVIHCLTASILKTTVSCIGFVFFLFCVLFWLLQVGR